MLKNTFVHIPTIGEIKERRLWKDGITDWDTYLKRAGKNALPRWIHIDLQPFLKQSKICLEQKDHHYFKENLPRKEVWRMFPEFRESTVYLDIETTGLESAHHDITVVGLYDGNKVTTFIKGKNLDELPGALEQYTTIVTFNGIQFDIPFICSKFPEATIHQVQLDLRFILRKLGYWGGLKKIERLMGITRTKETEGLSGLDAVRLWRQYENGNKEALETLIEYNTEDIVNLEYLMKYAYQRLRERTLSFD